MGTAGGMYHFRDQISCGNPTAFFVINGDVCGDFPLIEMSHFYGEKNALIVVAGTEATRNQSINYGNLDSYHKTPGLYALLNTSLRLGCIVSDKNTREILHYVEKPSTFVSTVVNCGVYLCSLEIFSIMASVFKKKEEEYVYEACFIVA